MGIPSDQLIAQLKRHEGFYAKPYLCTASACTIGYGTNLDSHPKFIPWPDIRRLVSIGTLRGPDLKAVLLRKGMEWTREQAHDAMMDEVRSCIPELVRRCVQYVKLESMGDIPRAEVLLNMAFNMGVPTLMTFKNTLAMLDAAIRGDGTFAAVGRGMLNSKWAKQVKGRARELAKQMETGRYQ